MKISIPPVVILLVISAFLHAGEPVMKPDTESFLSRLRTQASGDTWARLDGTVRHIRRQNRKEAAAPLSFRTILGTKTVVAQLIFREKEICMLTQARTAPYSSSVESGGNSTLEDFGLRPSDLVMNFIYWKCRGELPEETGGLQQCRVLAFENPDAAEEVRVFASAAYGIPLRVQWFERGGEKPFRTMEVRSVKKVNDLWVVEELSVTGPGWRSTVRFEKFEAGYMKQGAPADLFAE